MLSHFLPPDLKLSTLLICLGALASLVSAWFIQYVLGYQPCQLCYLQRWPYYLALGIGIASLITIRLSMDQLGRLAAVLVGVIMLCGAGIAVYHSGVEWKFWPGPSSCTAGNSMSGNITDLMAQVKQARIVPCDQPPFRLFGLSPANYNVLISLAFSVFCFYAARASWKTGR